jgi:hypothetical protein
MHVAANANLAAIKKTLLDGKDAIFDFSNPASRADLSEVFTNL